MANLRNYKGDYNIGLDMGTGSVGWAVTDSEGKLLHFKNSQHGEAACSIVPKRQHQHASPVVSAGDMCVDVGA